jgi:murein DD-endopeptidase MepM/ murein hydrolase activator NlpD
MVIQELASSFRGHMKKISLELPKYRLQLHLKLVKRRKPLLSEPIIPTKSAVNKKYRKGTFAGRLVRYIADHKSIRGVFTGSFALVTITSAFIPQATRIQAEGVVNPVIETQTNLITQKGMQYPLEVIKINQKYGFFHPGVDFGGPKGTSVKSIMPGVVAYAGWDRSGYGNLVVISHVNGLDSYYAHLSRVQVNIGQTVEMNTEIGLLGATGHATGPHLHLEIHQNGASLNPLTVLSR